MREMEGQLKGDAEGRGGGSTKSQRTKFQDEGRIRRRKMEEEREGGVRDFIDKYGKGNIIQMKRKKNGMEEHSAKKVRS